MGTATTGASRDPIRDFLSVVSDPGRYTEKYEALAKQMQDSEDAFQRAQREIAKLTKAKDASAWADKQRADADRELAAAKGARLDADKYAARIKREAEEATAERAVAIRRREAELADEAKALKAREGAAETARKAAEKALGDAQAAQAAANEAERRFRAKLSAITKIAQEG